MSDPIPEPLPFSRLERVIGNLIAPRMGWWLYLSIALLLGVAYFAAPMLKVILYKAVILTLAAFIGDKIARHLEDSNERPHELLERATAEQNIELALDLARRADAAYYRRAIIVAAAMIAAALGT
jgi:hypothetical protein